MKESRSTIRDVVELLGLAALMSFTAVITALAIISGGALIFFYEPNKLIWVIEVCVGSFGVGIGLIRVYEIICGANE